MAARTMAIPAEGGPLGSPEGRVHDGPPDLVVVSLHPGATLHLTIDRPPRLGCLDGLDRCEQKRRGIARREWPLHRSLLRLRLCLRPMSDAGHEAGRE